MANVEYKNMVDGEAKSGANYLECAVGALSVGDVVVRVIEPAVRPNRFRQPRVPEVTTIETYTVTGIGSEFYSPILECDAVRAYCDKVIEFK